MQSPLILENQPDDMNAHVSRLKMLLIEQDDAVINDIRSALAPPAETESKLAFDIYLAVYPTNGLAYLNQLQFHIIFLAFQQNSTQTEAAIRALSAAAPTTPIIVLVKDDAEAETAVHLGADETLTKNNLAHPLLSKIIKTIIQQKKVKLALAENEAQRKAIISNITDGIIVLDESFRILFINPAAEKLLNQSAESLLGTTLPVHQSENAAPTLTIHTHSASPKQVELILTDTIWEGNFAYFASFRDGSSQAEIKNQLSQKNIFLENRNYELDQFNSTMAHQVQGLLGQIIGYASLLEMHHDIQLDEEAQLMLNRINQSSHKMNNVINELMLLSSIDHDAVDMIPLDMERILIEVFKRLRFQLDKYNGRIHQPHSWPAALGQPSWIEEVWVNYITNGLKYGGDPPQLELGATTLNNGMIRFWVRDNGTGISPQDQKRLFKPHTRLKQLKVRGEGLGLSIVKRIVHKCGGEVGVISELGDGSTFWFTLKAASDTPKE
ncbi:MAG: hypothetical protein Kow0080_08370 [Candidatus Promineifilaceae bacterium]